MKQFAKWLSLCLIAMLAFTVTAFAQDEDTTDEEPVVVYDPDDIEGSRNLTSGKLVIGGNGTFGISGNTLFFEFSPFVAYRPIDKLLVGVGMNYSGQTERYATGIGTPDNVFKYRYVGGRVLSRFLLFHVGDPAGIYASTEFQYNKISFNLDGEKIPVGQLGFEVDKKSSMLFGLGYSSNFYQGFGYTIDLMYDVLWDENTSFNEWPILYRVGFTYGF